MDSPAGDDDGFQVVRSTRRQRAPPCHRRSEQPQVAGPLPSPGERRGRRSAGSHATTAALPDPCCSGGGDEGGSGAATLLLTRLERAKQRLAGIRISEQARTFLALFRDACGGTSCCRTVDVTCLGLGSLRHGSNPLTQLAFLSLLTTEVEAAFADGSHDLAGGPPFDGGPPRPLHVRVSVCDPDFDDTDRAVFGCLGYTVGSPGAPHTIRPDTPTVLFMPHCDHSLYSEVLHDNAGGGRLGRVCLVGNSLSWIHATGLPGLVASRAPSPAETNDASGAAALQRMAAATTRYSGVGAISAQAEASATGGQQSCSDGLGGEGVTAVEVPIVVPRSTEWESERVALDCTSFHLFRGARRIEPRALPAGGDDAQQPQEAVRAQQQLPRKHELTENKVSLLQRQTVSPQQQQVIIIACGTRGDVEPCAHVARATLSRWAAARSPGPRGHLVFATHRDHAPWLTSAGLLDRDAAGVGGAEDCGYSAVAGVGAAPPRASLRLHWLPSAPARSWRGATESDEAGEQHEEAIRDLIVSSALPAGKAGLQEGPSSRSGGNTVVCFNLFSLEAPHVCEALRLPCVALAPYQLPRTCPPDFLPWLQQEWPAVLNSLLLSGRLASVEAWQYALYNPRRWTRLRAKLGLPELPYAGYSAGAGLASRPHDAPSAAADSDCARPLFPAQPVIPLVFGEPPWFAAAEEGSCRFPAAAAVSFSGFWYSEGEGVQSRRRLPQRVCDFLAADGQPSVLFSLGSMPELGVFTTPELRAVGDCFREACQRCNARGLWVLSGGGQPALDPPAGDDKGWMEWAGALPFDDLLPSCAAIVHHGGSGTVGAALRHGVPQVLLPCVFDQPVLAARMVALGVSPPGPPGSAWALLDLIMAGPAGAREGVAQVTAQLRAALGDCGVARACASIAARLREEGPGCRAAADVVLAVAAAPGR